jgi:hypothetical protein
MTFNDGLLAISKDFFISFSNCSVQQQLFF